VLVNNWLQGFPYNIGLNWWVFAVAGVISLIISQLTITGQVYSVARINPAEALRYE
jgi:putative ABC transport system permease protein